MLAHVAGVFVEKHYHVMFLESMVISIYTVYICLCISAKFSHCEIRFFHGFKVDPYMNLPLQKNPDCFNEASRCKAISFQNMQ